MGKTRKGMTLIEIMIVVAILSILVLAAIPAYSRHVARGRQSNAQAALAAVQVAMENYRAKQGAYPASGTAVETLPGYDISSWQSVEPQARYYLSIEESSADYYRLRATCQPPVCNIDSDSTADIWEVTSTSGTKPVNILNDVTN